MTRFLGMTQRISLGFWSRCLAFAFLTFLTAGFQNAGCGGNPYIPPVTGSFDTSFYNPGTDGTVNAIVVDPRSGNVFIGGSFSSIGSQTAYNIAVFDVEEDRWFQLKEFGLKNNGGPEIVVNALAIKDNYLYVGGNFIQTVNDPPIILNNIARYNIDTKEWTPLAGNGLNGTVRALSISNNELFVGGDFSMTFDGTTATNLNRIARYDLASNPNPWSPLAHNGLSGASGVGGSVYTLAISGNRLFVGGQFSQNHNGANLNLLNNIALFNLGTNTWSPLTGDGLNGNVYALTISNNLLYVGGDFSQTNDGGTLNLNNIAYYDFLNSPNAWFPLTDNGLDGDVRALSSTGTNLFVGGYFSQTADGMTNLARIAVFNFSNVEWLELGGGLNETVSSLSFSGNILYIGGDFSQTVLGGFQGPQFGGIAGFQFTENNVASINDAGSIDLWSRLGPNNGLALDDQVNALAAHANGNIYVGGQFTQTADGATTNMNGIARFNPATKTWSALANNGLNGPVFGLAISGDILYVGGEFSQTNDGAVTNMRGVARYNTVTNTWSALANDGLAGIVLGLAISGDNLYAGGDFSRTFDDAVLNLNNVARYNTVTNTWSPLANNGLNGGVYGGLAISGDNLFAGGVFTQTFNGAVTNLNNIARYNTVTNTWSPLANNGLSGGVYALSTTDNFLFVRGSFLQTFDGATNLDRIARYHTGNNTWAPITGNADVLAAARATNATVRSGNDQYIGGFFTGVNSGVARYFTRYYIQQWNVPALSKGFTTTDWHDSANWTTGTAPAANTNAVIPAGSGTVNITSADVTMNDFMVNGGTLTVGTGRTLTINGILGLNGGIINGEGTLVISNCQQDGIMGGDSVSYIQTALVRCVNDTGTFNFPVGTVNGYSPITVKNITGTGNVLIKANQGAYPNPAAGLPVNRLARWWQIENPGGGITNADLIFGYLQSDIIGVENNYKSYRIAGGMATMINSTVNTFSNRVTAENVTGFSDWALAELAPTAASVSVGGRVLTANGNGINRAYISLTDGNGFTRRAKTNSFGYYSFDSVEVGETYIISVMSKRYQFAQPTQVLSVNEELNDVNFTALPE